MNSLQIPNLHSHGALGLMGHRHVLNGKVGYIGHPHINIVLLSEKVQMWLNCGQILVIKLVENDAIGSRIENHWELDAENATL